MANAPVTYELHGDRRLAIRAENNELVVSVESLFDGEWLRFATIHTNDQELVVGTRSEEPAGFTLCDSCTDTIIDGVVHDCIGASIDDTPMFFATPRRVKDAAGWAA